MKFTKSVLSVVVVSVIFMLASAAELPKCGQVFAASGNSIGGKPSKSHYWKWLVAFRQISTSEFFCAGSLVSAKHVISAAHCFWNKGQPVNKRKLPHEVVALVGKHDLTVDNEEGSVKHEIREIWIHEDWKPLENDFDADLSLLVLEKEVDLEQTEYVSIVCLPAASQNEVTGSGTVVGWGISERSLAKKMPHDSVPNELEVPAVTEDQCLDADNGFHISLSDRMFCAGFVNQNKSACKGDSGGGFLQYDRALKGYKLSGIVSASLIDRMLGDCRMDTYSMFTSVGKFVGWIEAKMDETRVNRFIEVDMECWEAFSHDCNHTYTGPFSKNIRLRQSYANATSVTMLDMYFKPSPYIFAGIGKNFPNVGTLYITQSIKFIERNNFKDMEQLEWLDLADNEIEIIDEGTFNDLPNLNWLRLNNNKIKQLPSNIFNNLKNHDYIDLSNNKISTLPRENLELIVEIYNNPGLTTNNVDFSKVPNVHLRNETDDEYYQRGEHFYYDGTKIQ